MARCIVGCNSGVAFTVSAILVPVIQCHSAFQTSDIGVQNPPSCDLYLRKYVLYVVVHIR